MKNNVKTKTAAPKMKIALLSFGSLLKTGRDLVVGGKFHADGPNMPVEFCRISQKGNLALGINEKIGVINRVFHARAKSDNLNTVIKSFLKLEGITENRICVLDLKSRVASERANHFSNVSKGVAKWATDKGYDAVIFSGLGRKFKSELDVPWSVQNAINYINGLNAAKKKQAIAHINGIPKQIATPFREVWEKGIKKAAK